MLCRLQTYTSSSLHTNVSNGYLVDCFLLLHCSQRRYPTTTHTKVCCRCRHLAAIVYKRVGTVAFVPNWWQNYLSSSLKHVVFCLFHTNFSYHKSMMGRPVQSIICAVVAIAHSVFIETGLCLFVCLSLQIVYIIFPVMMRHLSSYQTRATIEQVAGLRSAFERFIF